MKAREKKESALGWLRGQNDDPQRHPWIKCGKKMDAGIAPWILAEIRFRLEFEYFSLCLWPDEVLREKYEFPAPPDSCACMHGARPASTRSDRSNRAAGKSFSNDQADLVTASRRREIAFWRLRSDRKLTAPRLSAAGTAWASKYLNSQCGRISAVWAISLSRLMMTWFIVIKKA